MYLLQCIFVTIACKQSGLGKCGLVIITNKITVLYICKVPNPLEKCFPITTHLSLIKSSF